jgi:maltooligosyltrehalose trehalohydrolase
MSERRGAIRSTRRRLGQGAELIEGGVHFRVWAPTHHKVEVVLDRAASGSPAASATSDHPMRAEDNGYWSCLIDGIGAGTRYHYRIDGDDLALPDPASRFLPEGPHGPSEVVDPRSFSWTDSAWTGLPLHGQVIYELHIGTFSPEGNWQGAMANLTALKQLGVTVIEVMPVADFPGRFGWGYDGVAWYAPTHLYGAPDDFRRFVDRAHKLGMGVILDVVYNHFGPDGNYIDKFSPYYFAQQSNEWGRVLNFDGEHCTAVRQLVTDNAAYWIDEFHLDGLRLDATQSYFDRSHDDNIIAAIGREARAASGGRRLLIIGENERQDTTLLRSVELGGFGLDGLWNDDFHHSIVVALSGQRQAYFSDYRGTSNEWLATAKHGFLYQGQRSSWQKQRRGHSTRGLPAAAFVTFLENHDQVANSLWGARVWQQANPACHRAMTAFLLLGPWTPLLFQGQEWNASTPFHYFADHKPDLAKLVREGRAKFMSQFPGCEAGPGKDMLPDPGSPDVFAACRLRWDERDLPAHQRALMLHRDLLALRRSDPTLGAHAATGVSLEVAPLSPTCGIIRYFVDGPIAGAGARDRLLIVNLGPDLELDCPAEPLLAPPAEPGHTAWRTLWCSEDPRYGGNGCAEPESEDRGWRVPGSATVLMSPLTRV